MIIKKGDKTPGYVYSNCIILFRVMVVIRGLMPLCFKVYFLKRTHGLVKGRDMAYWLAAGCLASNYISLILEQGLLKPNNTCWQWYLISRRISARAIWYSCKIFVLLTSNLAGIQCLRNDVMAGRAATRIVANILIVCVLFSGPGMVNKHANEIVAHIPNSIAWRGGLILLGFLSPSLGTVI